MASNRCVLTGAILTRWPEPDLAADVAIEGGRITEIGHSLTIGASDRRHRLDGLRLAPGFIDLQVNGGYGLDITADPSAMWELAQELPRHGVTSFLPTVITSRSETIDRALVAVGRDRDDLRAEGDRGDGGDLRGADRSAGARILGLHLEGPFIHHERRGTHPSQYVASPGAADISHWTAEAGVRMVTLAPELPGATDVIRQLTAQGVVVAAGHSGATYDDVGVAIDAGLRTVTHLFNGMPHFEHREPGLVGRALTDERLMASMIVDGHHLHPATVVIAFRSLGVDRTLLVSDSTAATGRPPGQYLLGDVPITLDDDGVLRNAEGVLAGSVLTLDEAVRNLWSVTGCSEAAAIATATATPSRLLDERSLGTIAVGAHADLVVLDERLDVCATIADGVVVHDPDGRFDHSVPPHDALEGRWRS